MNLQKYDKRGLRRNLPRAAAPARQHRADRQREHRLQGGAAGGGHHSDQQICRGAIPASAITAAVSTSTSSRISRATAPRSSSAPSMPTYSPIRRQRQPRGVFRAADARRHRDGHESGARRTSVSRLARQHLRQVFQHRTLRRGRQTHTIDYDKMLEIAREVQAENDRRRRERVCAEDRLQALPRDCGRGRRVSDGRHGTSPALSPPACTKARCLTRTWSRPPRIRRCAARAAV